jgi:hypothetical protein
LAETKEVNLLNVNTVQQVSFKFRFGQGLDVNCGGRIPEPVRRTHNGAVAVQCTPDGSRYYHQKSLFPWVYSGTSLHDVTVDLSTNCFGEKTSIRWIQWRNYSEFVKPVGNMWMLDSVRFTPVSSGVYKVNFNPTVSGSYSLSVKLILGAGIATAVPGSPYAFTVKPGPASIQHSVVTPSFFQTVSAGVQISALIQMKDSFGNNRVSSGGDLSHVKVVPNSVSTSLPYCASSSSTLSCMSVSDNYNGTYSVRFTATVSDTYAIHAVGQLGNLMKSTTDRIQAQAVCPTGKVVMFGFSLPMANRANWHYLTRFGFKACTPGSKHCSGTTLATPRKHWTWIQSAVNVWVACGTAAISGLQFVSNPIRGRYLGAPSTTQTTYCPANTTVAFGFSMVLAPSWIGDQSRRDYIYSCEPGADSCTNYFSSASYYDTIYSWVGCGDNSAAVSAMRENVTYVAKGYFGYSLDEVTSTGRTVSSSCPPRSVVYFGWTMHFNRA